MIKKIAMKYIADVTNILNVMIFYIEANFDFEKIDFSANTTELYFPVGKTNISRINSVDIFTFMHNQEYY